MEMEELIATVVAEVLEQEKPASNDNLFELGVDSLSGQRVINQLEKELGMKLRTTLLFDFPTVGELAMKLEQMLNEALVQLESAS